MFFLIEAPSRPSSSSSIYYRRAIYIHDEQKRVENINKTKITSDLARFISVIFF